MAITIKHAKTDTISDWTQTNLDAQIALGNFPPGTVLADIVLPSDWNNSHTLSGTVPVANGGTGATTLTGYVKGNGTSAFTASSTIPSTDVTGLGTMSTQNANSVAITGGSISGTTVSGYIPTTDRGIANGVASLDGSGTVPVSQLPAAVLGALSYQGTWNASTNTPTLTSSTGTKGYYYVVNVAGSTNLNGITDWQIGDWAVYNGSAWQKIDNTDAVTSVNSKTGTVVLTYSDITSGVVPVVNGGTGVTTSSGANSVVLRDANANITTNCLFEGFINQVAGTLITLTASSVQNWVITGSGGQTIKLPDATTLPSGALFTFNNNQSSGTIVIQNNSSTTIATLQSGAFSTIVLLSNSTAAGSWDRHDQAPSNVSWSTNTLDYAGSITSATWNGTAIALNRGGTNANLTAVNGGAVYSTGTGLAISAAGTSGQVLTSSGAGAPTWTTPITGTVTSVTGTAPISSSGGATPAISISQATTSTNGYLSSTDWNTFNNKGSGTVTSVSGTTGRITSTGGNTPVIDLASGVATAGTTGSSTLIPVVTIDTYGRVTSITTASNPQGTVTSVTGTAPVVSSGGATPAISMAAANTTTNGYLTSTDWNTFNGKGSGTVTSVAALTLGTTGTDLSSTVATGTTTPVITLQVPTASATNRGALSAADWTTFNSKGSGTVTSVSVASANGFAGTVATATTTPAITISTSITGILSGNGTAISAATTTGSGSVVLATSPTLVTPTLGVASATSVNKVTVTTPATGSTLTLVDGSTLATSGAFSTTLTSTATTNVTLPTTGTLSTLAGTETLTNKTLTNPTVTNYTESVVSIGTVTSSNTLSLTNGTVQTATLTASTACTFTMPTATAGKSFILLLKQAATTGNGTATFTGVKFNSTGAPTITATAGKMDILSFVSDGTNWYGSYTQGYTP